jgi:hypothetical protein
MDGLQEIRSLEVICVGVPILWLPSNQNPIGNDSKDDPVGLMMMILMLLCLIDKVVSVCMI